MKKFLFIITLLISAFGLNAQNVGDETAINCGSYYLKFSITGNYTCRLFEYVGAPVNVTIPSTVTFSGKEFAVTSIESAAFSGCSSLTSIEIPNSVTSIESAAFSGCSSLTSIEFEENSLLTFIGNNAFSVCSSLTSIEIPSGVTFIGNAAFSYCDNLTSIEIPSGVTSIEDIAFYGCSSLTSIEIPSGVTSIGGSAFSGCSSLTSIEIPSGVTSIGELVFEGCYSLTSIIVESGNTVYDSRNNCNAIIETATNTLIAGCQNTVIPNTVSFIGDNAFHGCSSLTSLEIPSGIISIGDNAFFDCSSLISIEIPSGVTSIGEYVFYGCSSLTSIDFEENSLLTFIGNNAFCNCSSLTSIEIPSGVTSIGDCAFENCSSLTSIEIPNSVTYIGDVAFNCCSSLTSIEIPNSVTYIGDDAFSGCSSLTKIYCYAENVPETDYFGWTHENMVILVPEQSLDDYKAASPWNNYPIFPLGTEGPAAPQNLTAQVLGYNDEINLSWDAVEGAEYYNVYKFDELYEQTSNVNTTIYGLSSNTEYCFKVTAVNVIGESEKSEEVCIKTLVEGVEELSMSFNIYPNPVNDNLYIETQILTQTIEIYDAFGRQQLIANGQQPTAIDVSNLNSGVYFIKIKTNEGVITKRFVKN